MSTMKNFDDNELDLLLQQSASHKKAVEQINRQVMQTVQRDMRLKKVRKWVRLLGFSFGLPMLVIMYIYMICNYMPEMPTQLQIIFYTFSIGTILAIFGTIFHDVSPSDM